MHFFAHDKIPRALFKIFSDSAILDHSTPLLPTSCRLFLNPIYKICFDSSYCDFQRISLSASIKQGHLLTRSHVITPRYQNFTIWEIKTLYFPPNILCITHQLTKDYAYSISIYLFFKEIMSSWEI